MTNKNLQVAKKQSDLKLFNKEKKINGLKHFQMLEYRKLKTNKHKFNCFTNKNTNSAN